MNIFILDPEKAARDQCDKHVVKMILESAQLMATAMHLSGMDTPYKPTHKNHPCSIWVREARDNYLWLLGHHKAMLDEYTARYGRVHATQAHCDFWVRGVRSVPEGSLTEFAQAMPEDLRVPGDAVQAYRSDKVEIATWKSGNYPDWWRDS